MQNPVITSSKCVKTQPSQVVDLCPASWGAIIWTMYRTYLLIKLLTKAGTFYAFILLGLIFLPPGYPQLLRSQGPSAFLTIIKDLKDFEIEYCMDDNSQHPLY